VKVFAILAGDTAMPSNKIKYGMEWQQCMQEVALVKYVLGTC